MRLNIDPNNQDIQSTFVIIKSIDNREKEELAKQAKAHKRKYRKKHINYGIE